MAFWNRKKDNAVKKTAILQIRQSNEANSQSFVEVVKYSQVGFGLCKWHIYAVVLLANGTTNYGNLSWRPIAGWTNEELANAGFYDSVPQTVENMLAIAILRGDKAAALALADRVVAGEIQWKEEGK